MSVDAQGIILNWANNPVEDGFKAVIGEVSQGLILRLKNGLQMISSRYRNQPG
jgi:hypothetical protein